MEAACALIEKLITENAELVEKVINSLSVVAIVSYFSENILCGLKA
jgi:hypothetical protein